jgi:hypothetical protein
MKNSLQSFVTYSFFCLFVGSLRCVSELNFAANYFLQQQFSFNVSFRNLPRKIRCSPHLFFISFLDTPYSSSGLCKISSAGEEL